MAKEGPEAAVVGRSCVPSATSPEAGLIGLQALLLISRTLMTDHITRVEGRAARFLIAQAGSTHLTLHPRSVASCMHCWCILQGDRTTSTPLAGSKTTWMPGPCSEAAACMVLYTFQVVQH